MKKSFLFVLLAFLLLIGCKSKSAESTLVDEPAADTAEIITQEEAEEAMHAIAPEPVRIGEEKDASEFVAPGDENLRFIGQYGYQLDDGGAYMGGTTISYYDFETKTSMPVCDKADCLHDNTQCPAWIGADSDYAKSGDAFYVFQRNQSGGDWAFRIQKRDVDSESWEPVWEYASPGNATLVTDGMLGSEWAVLPMNEYLNDGETMLKVLAVNLQNGTEVELIPSVPIGFNIDLEDHAERTLSAALWGVSEQHCVISRTVLPADFPTLEEHLAATGPFESEVDQYAATDAYIAQIDSAAVVEYACYDLSTGEKTIISSDVSGAVTGVCDQTALYQGEFYYFKDGAIRAYNLKDKSEKEILNAGDVGKISVVDGQVFYVLAAGEFCELNSYSLSDGTITKFTNESNPNTIVFTVYQESGDTFAGNYNGMECWISKADYYAENFSAALPIGYQSK